MKVFGLNVFTPKKNSVRYFKNLGFELEYSGYFPIMHEVCLSKGRERVYYIKKKIKQHVIFADNGFRNGIEIIY